MQYLPRKLKTQADITAIDVRSRTRIYANVFFSFLKVQYAHGICKININNRI